MTIDRRYRYVGCVEYILLNICKKLNKPIKYKFSDYDKPIKSYYKPVDFYDLKWIIDRANYLNGKHYCFSIISYEFVSIFCEDCILVPEQFVYNIKDYNLLDNVSISDIRILDKIIARYKLYGKICCFFQKLYYKVCSKLRKLK